MTDNAKKKIALDFIAALSSGNKTALQAIMADDIVWSLPGSSPMSGEAHGVEAILKRSEILHAYGVKIEIEYVVFGFRDVAQHLHNTGKRDGYYSHIASGIVRKAVEVLDREPILVEKQDSTDWGWEEVATSAADISLCG